MNLASATFKKIVDTTCAEFEQALQIYSTSFPPVETKPIYKIVKMIKTDQNYCLFVTIEDHLVVGLSLLYTFPLLGIGLLDYLAVTPNWQRKGIGTRLFRYTLNRLIHEMPNSVGLLLEIQTENVSDPIERKIREDRLTFYSRLGVKNLAGVSHLIPPQHGTKPEQAYLMIAPLKTIYSLSKDTVIQYIRALHSKVYQYSSRDLLDVVTQSLPEQILLSDIPIGVRSNQKQVGR